MLFGDVGDGLAAVQGGHEIGIRHADGGRRGVEHALENGTAALEALGTRLVRRRGVLERLDDLVLLRLVDRAVLHEAIEDTLELGARPLALRRRAIRGRARRLGHGGDRRAGRKHGVQSERAGPECRDDADGCDELLHGAVRVRRANVSACRDRYPTI